MAFKQDHVCDLGEKPAGKAIDREAAAILTGGQEDNGDVGSRWLPGQRCAGRSRRRQSLLGDENGAGMMIIDRGIQAIQVREKLRVIVNFVQESHHGFAVAAEGRADQNRITLKVLSTLHGYALPSGCRRCRYTPASRSSRP